MRIAVGLAAACVALALSGSASVAAPCSGLVVDGTPGNDVIRGGSGDDCLRGGDGADQLYGGFGADQLDGGAGNDVIEGDQDRNVVRGGAGDDRIDVSNGVIDDVDCGPGRDRVVADRGDRLRGCEVVRFALSPYPLVKPHGGGARTTFTVYFRALYPAGAGRGEYVIGVVHGACVHDRLQLARQDLEDAHRGRRYGALPASTRSARRLVPRPLPRRRALGARLK